MSPVSIFGKATTSERDHNQIIELQKQVLELQREVTAMRRELEGVDLHARAIAEESKRLINKFERRLDREDQGTTQSRQDASGRTIGPRRAVGDGIPPIDPPGPRRNY